MTDVTDYSIKWIDDGSSGTTVPDDSNNSKNNATYNSGEREE
jgi:hypothetical protein